RRGVSSAVARWLAEAIAAAFGPHSVFIDSDAIRVGDDWPARIDAALHAASVLIVVVGPSWLRMADEHGRRRLDLEDDWVRTEVLHALAHKRPLLPLLVSQATLPAREGLPPALAPLLNHQAFEMRDDHWQADLQALLRALEGLGFRRLHPGAGLPPVGPEEQARRQALIFDKQLGTLKTALSLVYRSRNA